jgi:hypothetical protein
MHFTFAIDDFLEYEKLESPVTVVTTAIPVYIIGKGSVLINHEVKKLGISRQRTTCLYPVFHIPWLTVRLLSLGELLQQGMSIHGDAQQISLSLLKICLPILQCFPQHSGENFFGCIQSTQTRIKFTPSMLWIMTLCINT